MFKKVDLRNVILEQLQKQAYQWNSYILINKGFHTNSSVSIAYFY